MRRRLSALTLALVGLVSIAALASCGGSDDGNASAGGSKPLTIGFLYVGPSNDYGYNQAAYQGSLAVEEAFPKAHVEQAENVPETA